MSKLTDFLNVQAAEFEAAAQAGLTVTKTGATVLDLVVGEPSTFPAVLPFGLVTGLVHFDEILGVNMAAYEQRYLDKNRQPEARMIDGEMRTEHIVFTCGFVVPTKSVGGVPQGRVRILDEDEPSGEAMLPIELKWVEKGNPHLFLYGEQQGCGAEGIAAVNDLLLKQGWVVPPERAAGNFQRKLLWSLQAPGTSFPQQITNGLPVATMKIRSSDRVDPNTGEDTGFKNFVDAGWNNGARFLKWGTTHIGDEATLKDIERHLTCLTGARTQEREAADIAKDPKDRPSSKTVSYSDKAGIPEFTVITGKAADGSPITEDVSVWKPVKNPVVAAANGAEEKF